MMNLEGWLMKKVVGVDEKGKRRRGGGEVFVGGEGGSDLGVTGWTNQGTCLQIRISAQEPAYTRA